MFWGQHIVAPVLTADGSFLGFVRTRINLSKLFNAYFAADVLANMDVSLFCTHRNGQPLPAPAFLHTNMDGIRLTARGITSDNTTTYLNSTTIQDNLWSFVQAQVGQPGLLLERSFQLGNLAGTAYFTPTAEYLANFEPKIARRWSLFAVALIITGIIMLLVVIGMVSVHFCGMTVSVLQARLNDLKKTKFQMNSLIEQLSLEEERTRIALSVLPTSIAFFNAAGNLVFANETFIQNLHYAEHEVTSGTVNIQKLLPQLDMTVLQRRPKRFAVTTNVRSAFNVELSFFVTITFLSDGTSSKGRNGADGNPFKAIAKTEITERKFSADFIVTIDHRSDTSTYGDATDNDLTEVSSSSDSPRSHQGGATDDQMFEGMFRDDAPLMVEFHDFCVKEHADEGLSFYRDVCEYRRIKDTFTRVKRQQEIYFEFLHDMAFQPLNLPGNADTSRELEKIRKNLGQPDVFDGILAIVLQEMRHDLFERFLYLKRTCMIQQVAASPTSPRTPVSVGQDIPLQDANVWNANEV